MAKIASQTPGRYDHLDVRVYPEEKAMAQAVAAELGFQGAADLVRAIITRLGKTRRQSKRAGQIPIHIHLPNRAESRQVAYQLAAIGNNHNQIARRLNLLAVSGVITGDETVSAEDLARYFHGTTQALESLKETLRRSAGAR